MIVGVCGYSYTGSGAVIDFLKEFANTEFCYNAEFLLPYYPDGIEDLEYHLCDRFTKYASGYMAIERYKRMVYILTSHLNKLPNDKRNEIKRITDSYLESLIQHKWKGYSTADILLNYGNRMSFCIQTSIERLLNHVYKSIFKGRRLSCYPMRSIQLCIEPEDFIIKTRKYINEILTIIGFNWDKVAILDQPFSVNHPEVSMRYFDSAKCIIVDRDPRDLYLYSKMFLKNTATQIPVDNVYDFVKYYRVMRRGTNINDSDMVMHLNFEDLVYNYDSTSDKIIDFCGLSIHESKHEYFDPNVSIRNTYMMNKFDFNTSDIEYIERELPNFLYHFDLDKVKKIDGKMFS